MPHTGHSSAETRRRFSAGRKRGRRHPIFVRSVNHPGTKAQPFLGPSAEIALKVVKAKIPGVFKNLRLSQPAALVRRLNLMLRTAAFAAQRVAKQLAPVDTSRLKGSINVREESALSFVVGTNVEYARFVEEGTRPHVIRPRTKKVLHFMSKKRQGKSRGGKSRR